MTKHLTARTALYLRDGATTTTIDREDYGDVIRDHPAAARRLLKDFPEIAALVRALSPFLSDEDDDDDDDE